MSVSKHNLTVRMGKIGMAWATTDAKHTSPDDPMGDQVRGRKTYHVHPDCGEPWANAIKRFDTLKDLAEYISLREAYNDVIQNGVTNYNDQYVLSLEDELRQY